MADRDTKVLEMVGREFKKDLAAEIPARRELKQRLTGTVRGCLSRLEWMWYCGMSSRELHDFLGGILSLLSDAFDCKSEGLQHLCFLGSEKAESRNVILMYLGVFPSRIGVGFDFLRELEAGA